ncbi:MAG: fimbria/pilus outer membrane usher protein [Hyphomonas sp.]
MGKRLLAFSAFTTLIAMIARPAWGEAQDPVDHDPVSASYVVNLPVVVDGRTVGTLLVRLSTTSLTDVEANSWRQIAFTYFDADKVESVLAAQHDGYIPESAFAASGIRIEFDPASLTIQLVASDDARVTRLVSLRPDPIDYSDLSAFDTSGRSAYFNIFGSQEIRWAGDSSATQEIARQISLEGAVRPLGAKGPAIEGAVFVDSSLPGDELRRGEVRIVHDDVTRAIRYSAGDVHFRGTEFQGSPPILGLSVERAYDQIQPLRAISPTGQRSFVLQQSSRVDVFVNGFFEKSVRLDPGRYDLQDFAFNAGVNEVRLVIEDINGQQRELDFSLFSDPGLLKAGLSEFSFNIGYRRDTNVFDELAYDFSTPSWSGFYRRGVTSSLTLGLNYQGTESHHVAGFEVSQTSQIGLISVNGSLSESDDVGTGAAASVRWSYDRIFSGQQRSHRIDLVGIIRTDGFLPLGVETPSERYRHELRARYSAPGPADTLISLSARYAEPFAAQEPTEQAYGVDVSRRFGRANVLVRAEQQISTITDTRFAVRMTMPIGRRQLVSGNWESEGNVSRLAWSRYGSNTVNSWNANAAVRRADSSVEFDVNTRYSGNRIEIGLDHIYTGFTDRDRSATQYSRATVGTSFAIAENGFGFGRPIYDSFAIVKRHRTLRETRILVDNGPAGPSAIADNWGPAVVPTINSYTIRRIRWNAENPPIAYDMGDTERDIFAFYRSGIGFTAGSNASLTAIGQAALPDGQPIVLTGGIIRPADGRDFMSIQTFTNAKGRFAAQSLEPGRYRAEFFTDPPIGFNFEIGRDQSGLIDLGILEPSDAEEKQP